MTVRATRGITIERRDGSNHRRWVVHGRDPALHEVTEATDDAERAIRVRIGSFTKHQPKAAGLGVFQITTQIID